MANNNDNIEKRWSFRQFVKENGKPQWATFQNSHTGEYFHKIKCGKVCLYWAKAFHGELTQKQVVEKRLKLQVVRLKDKDPKGNQIHVLCNEGEMSFKVEDIAGFDDWA